MDDTLTDAQLIELGRQHHMQKLGERRLAAKAELDATTDAIKSKLAELQEAGEVNEVQYAKLLGVDRQTVRSWLGKPRGKAGTS